MATTRTFDQLSREWQDWAFTVKADETQRACENRHLETAEKDNWLEPAMLARIADGVERLASAQERIADLMDPEVQRGKEAKEHKHKAWEAFYSHCQECWGRRRPYVKKVLLQWEQPYGPIPRRIRDRLRQAAMQPANAMRISSDNVGKFDWREKPLECIAACEAVDWDEYDAGLATVYQQDIALPDTIAGPKTKMEATYQAWRKADNEPTNDITDCPVDVPVGAEGVDDTGPG